MDQAGVGTPYSIPDPTAELNRPSKFALASALVGILCCIPPASCAALVLAVLALRSRRPQVGGRWLAGVGLALSLFGFGFFAWFSYGSFWLSGPATAFTSSFITDLSAKRIDAASGKCAAGIYDDDLEVWADDVRSIGPISSIECTLPLYQSCGSRRDEPRLTYTLDVTVHGVAGVARKYSICLVREDGQFRVWGFEPNR